MAGALIGGAVIGFVVIFALVTSILLIAGTTPITAVAIAIFVASFGGLGFGTMFGTNWYVHRFGEPH